jgi:hypothetical protein
MSPSHHHQITTPKYDPIVELSSTLSLSVMLMQSDHNSAISVNVIFICRNGRVIAIDVDGAMLNGRTVLQLDCASTEESNSNAN